MQNQPILTEKHLFAFNGDIFSDENQSNGKNDALNLFEQLSKTNKKHEISEILAKQTGPFSLIFYSRSLKLLFFCRDNLGRNSLLFSRQNSSTFIISSILGK